MVPENQVQQQQEAVAQMYPLAHLSHQPGDNVVIDIPQTEGSCSTSPAPAPSDTPSSPGSAASLPPSPPGPPPPPPPPPALAPAPHLPPIQDHYWTVIDKDDVLQFLNLSSSQVLQACLLDASELATISCVDIKYPSYVLPTTGGYSIVMLPNIFCIIGRQRSYFRHDKPVVYRYDPRADLAREIALVWPGGEGFDLHVMERVFGYTLKGLRDEKDTFDLSYSGGKIEVDLIEAFISKNINVKQAAEDASRIFKEREKGSSLCYFICRCEDNIRHLSDVVKESKRRLSDAEKEAERRIAVRKDRREKLFFALTCFSIIVASLGMVATLSVGITPSSSSSPPSPSLLGILALQKTLFSIGGIFFVIVLLCWIVISLVW